MAQDIILSGSGWWPLELGKNDMVKDEEKNATEGEDQDRGQWWIQRGTHLDLIQNLKRRKFVQSGYQGYNVKVRISLKVRRIC